MISKEVAQQIWQIQLKTRKILSGTMVGGQRTANKGAGFDFDQVREYAQGDDLRFIDWKSTARSGKLLTKQYFEERNHNIMIALDVSSSSFVSHKYSLMAELAAIFALVADYSKDNVGLTLFSDQINLQLPMKRAQAHTMRVMEVVFSFKPSVKASTNIDLVLNHLMRTLKKKTLIVLISDFIADNDYQRSLKCLQHRHDIVVVRCLDSYEQVMPALGILPIIDPETGELAVLDTRKNDILNLVVQDRIKQQDLMLRSCGVDVLDIKDKLQAVPEVVKFFRKRLMY